MTEYSLDLIMRSGDLAVMILATICVLAIIFYAAIVGLDFICYIGECLGSVLDFFKRSK